MHSVSERLMEIAGGIAAAALRSGRRGEDVELVAVSKTHLPDAIREASDSGHLLFGESRVQEAKAKIPLLPSNLRWHFIGHLQRNKVRAALPLFELFHGIDSLETARELQRVAHQEGFHPQVLLEVNVAGEASKFGFRSANLPQEMEELLSLDRLQISGLMTIAPFHPEAEHSRRYFAELRGIRDTIQKESGIGLPHLSMGMSGDYLVAVEEGATLVRVGSAIFGPRAGKSWKPRGSEEAE